MPKGLGDPVGPGYNVERYDSAGSAISAGDAVAIDQTSGDVELADSGNVDRDQFAGVAMTDADSGDAVQILTRASNGVVANVASGLSGGNRLDASATTGQLATSDGGPALALSDEGGSYKGASLGSGEGVIVY